MKKARVLTAATSLIAAAILLLLDATKYTFSLGSTHVVLYPALFFGVVGVVQLVRLAWRPE